MTLLIRDANYGGRPGVSRGTVKRTVLIAFALLAVLSAAMISSVWHASHDPLTHTPGPLENARAQLHNQLEDAMKTEAAAEKQGWDSPVQLRALMQGHQQRIEKLKDNKEAAEIVAYDRAAVDRLEQRIAQLLEQEAARAEAAKQAAAQAAKEAERETEQH